MSSFPPLGSAGGPRVSLGPRLRMLRVVFGSLCAAGFWYVYVAERFSRPHPSPKASLYWGIVGVAAAESLIVLFVRQRWVRASEALLLSQPENLEVLGRWLRGYIWGWALSLSIMLYGLCLRFMGATLSQAVPFYVVGALLLLLNPPRHPES